jgi:hypothetical protein
MARIKLTQVENPDADSDEMFVIETTTLDHAEGYDPTGCTWKQYSLDGIKPEIWQSEYGNIARRL